MSNKGEMRRIMCLMTVTSSAAGLHLWSVSKLAKSLTTNPANLAGSNKEKRDMHNTHRLIVLFNLIISVLFVGCLDDRDQQIIELQRENQQLRQQLEAAKPPPPSPSSTAPCTREMLSTMDKFTIREMERENQWQMSRYQDGMAVYELALITTISVVPPSDLPALPDGEVRIVATEQTLPLIHQGDRCTIGKQEEREGKVHTFSLNASWTRLVQLILSNFNNFNPHLEPNEEYRYGRQVDFFCSGLTPAVHGMASHILDEDDQNGLRVRVWKRLKAIAEDEQALKNVMVWAEKVVPAALDLEQKAVARIWLYDFWQASAANMSELDQALAKEEKENIERGEENWMSGLLWDKSLKREGLFLRRWRNAGKGKAGDDRIVMYRFWMARLAKALEMPQAQEWAKAVKAGLKGAGTLKHRPWYQSQL